MLYEIKMTVPRVNEKGETKNVREHYILEAETHGDAEAQGYAMYEGQQVDVFAVFRSKIREVVNEKEDEKSFFLVTVTDTFTDDNGAEKELSYQMLVCAANLMEAARIMEEYMKQGYDMTVNSLHKTMIKDYIH